MSRNILVQPFSLALLMLRYFFVAIIAVPLFFIMLWFIVLIVGQLGLVFFEAPVRDSVPVFSTK